MPPKVSVASPGLLLARIRAAGGLTRQALLQETGMSRSTLYTRLDQLLGAGLLVESRSGSPTGGRPASMLTFDAADRVVLALDLGHHLARVSVCSTEGVPLAERRVQTAASSGIADVVASLSDIGHELLDGFDDQLIGVGVAIPAPVQTHTGIRWRSVALPDADYPMLDDLRRRFDTLVCLENDARALALGTLPDGVELGDDDVLLAVKFSTGIGAGIMTGPAIMRGSTGSAGDIGHMRVTNGGAVCTCGARGCLAATAAGRSLVRDAARDDIATVEDLRRLYQAGDPQVVELVTSAAALLGRTLAGLAHALNPAVIGIGGTLGSTPGVFETIQTTIREFSASRIHEHASVRLLDHQRSSVGLARLVTDTAFSPTRVDAMLDE
ncbi:MAG: ROK family transcriptional regulator [Propionicimonas sp.]|nr:ROK family transcriptional regulator [Propionicimonas sp.]